MPYSLSQLKTYCGIKDNAPVSMSMFPPFTNPRSVADLFENTFSAGNGLVNIGGYPDFLLSGSYPQWLASLGDFYLYDGATGSRFGWLQYGSAIMLVAGQGDPAVFKWFYRSISPSGNLLRTKINGSYFGLNRASVPMVGVTVTDAVVRTAGTDLETLGSYTPKNGTNTTVSGSLSFGSTSGVHFLFSDYVVSGVNYRIMRMTTGTSSPLYVEFV